MAAVELKRDLSPVAKDWVKETELIPSVSLKQHTLWKKYDHGCVRWKIIIGPKEGGPLRDSSTWKISFSAQFFSLRQLDLNCSLNWIDRKSFGNGLQCTKVWIGPYGWNNSSISKIRFIRKLFRLNLEARKYQENRKKVKADDRLLHTEILQMTEFDGYISNLHYFEGKLKSLLLLLTKSLTFFSGSVNLYTNANHFK